MSIYNLNNEFNILTNYSKIFTPINDNYCLYFLSIIKPIKPNNTFYFYKNGFEIIGKKYKYLFLKNDYINHDCIDISIKSRENLIHINQKINFVLINKKKLEINLFCKFNKNNFKINDFYKEDISNILYNLINLLTYYNINFNIID